MSIKSIRLNSQNLSLSKLKIRKKTKVNDRYKSFRIINLRDINNYRN